MSTPEHDGEVFTLLPHEAARTITRLRARVAELEATIARALTVDRDYMDALARATAADAAVERVRADLDVMRDDPMPVPTEASRLPDGATVEEAYTAGWYRAIRAHERGLRRALDAASTPPPPHRPELPGPH